MYLRRQIKMEDDPRHELLALFEGIHNLKESDYKAFVETLARFNQKPHVNIEGAKYVRIAWERVELNYTRCRHCQEACSCCERGDDGAYLSRKEHVRIFRVVDEHICLWDTFVSNRGTKISKDMLEKIKCQLEQNHPTLVPDAYDVVVLTELEVLEREGTTS